MRSVEYELRNNVEREDVFLCVWQINVFTSMFSTMVHLMNYFIFLNFFISTFWRDKRAAVHSGKLGKEQRYLSGILLLIFEIYVCNIWLLLLVLYKLGENTHSSSLGVRGRRTLGIYQSWEQMQTEGLEQELHYSQEVYYTPVTLANETMQNSVVREQQAVSTLQENSYRQTVLCIRGISPEQRSRGEGWL